MNLKQFILFYNSVINTRIIQLIHRIKFLIKRFILSNLATQKFISANSLAGDNEFYLATVLPKPLFKPRINLILKEDNQIYTNFLNIKRPLVTPLDWYPGDMEKNKLWLFNLQYMEYLESIDDNDWFKFVIDWINSNKSYKKGSSLEGWHSYTLSIRIVVWMQQFEKKRSLISKTDLNLFLRSLLAQVRFLKSNLELDIGGNHLIKNIKALLWASKFFKGKEADNWHRLGLKLLKTNIDEQITEDGVHFELSPAYHAQVFADLLECYAIINDVSCNEKLNIKLPKMAQFLIDTTHPDGMISLFNDSGLHMAYQPNECIEVYERLFNTQLKSLNIVSYKNAGYFGLRSENNLVLFDAAELAPKFLPAHGHGDALSFEWSVLGQRVAIDPGVYEYEPGKLRDYSRSTKSHNTVTLDDHDQSEFWKSFRVGRRANIIKCDVNKDSGGLTITAAHDGYRRFKNSPIHCRKMSMYPGVINIVDSIKKGNGQIATARIMLAPEISIEIRDKNYFLIGDGFEILVESTNHITINEAICFLDFGCYQKTSQLVIEFGKAPCHNVLNLSVITNE